MVRAPCCEEMGLKKGPWTPEEDQTLVAYIQRYGHGNWRALPKQAGLLRCGKSCRLRWANYLRPDIKRGNFSMEEEETIITLHETLGNRWSAIAARLPGRTDNEIKNVWHTHLKKRLKQNQKTSQETKVAKMKRTERDSQKSHRPALQSLEMICPVSPRLLEESSSDSSTLTAENCTISSKDHDEKIIDEMEEKSLLTENVYMPTDHDFEACVQLPFSLLQHEENAYQYEDENMDFWFNLFLQAGELPQF